jgi:hypothetical protein
MDPDQTARMHRLVWIQAGRKRTVVTLFIFSFLRILKQKSKLIISNKSMQINFDVADMIRFTQINHDLELFLITRVLTGHKTLQNFNQKYQYHTLIYLNPP